MTRVSWATLQPGETEHVLSVMLCQGRDAMRIRPSLGDGGIDVIEVTPAGWVVDQIKYFATNLTNDQKRQIEESYRRLRAYAAEQNATVAVWRLWLPLDPTNENRIWFADFTRDAGYACRWRGLMHVEGLAAKYPEVIDYYLGNGKERLQNLIGQLIGVMNLLRQADGDPVTGIQPRDVEGDLGKLHAALNAHDPHYRYDFAVHGERPGWPTPDPFFAAEALRRQGDAWVVFRVYARMRLEEAQRERPIPIRIEASVPEGSGAAQTLDDFTRFGLPGSIHEQDGVSISGSVDLPGGLGTDFTGGTLYLGPVRSAHAEPYDLRMQLLDEHGQEMATARLNMEPTTTGPDGEGVCAVGVEEQGVFTIEIRADLRAGTASQHGATPDTEVNTAQMGTVVIRLADITNRRPAGVLPGLRAVGAFRPPHQVRFAAPYGPANYPGIPIPDQTNLHLDPIVKVVEALAVIQDHTTEQLSIPDPGQLSQQAGDLLRTAQLLQAHSLDVTWSELTEPVPTNAIDPHADLTTPAVLVVMKPLVATVGDHHVVLGQRRITLASARVESVTPSTDGQYALFKWVPGEDNTALIEYIPDP